MPALTIILVRRSLYVQDQPFTGWHCFRCAWIECAQNGSLEWAAMAIPDKPREAPQYLGRLFRRIPAEAVS